MLDIGWMELLVIGVVALLVVGPKELPALLRTIGRFIGMAKRQADEFRAQFDDAIRESEFEDIRREMNDIRQGRFNEDAKDTDRGAKSAPAQETDVDFEGQGTIEPAPEFRDEQPTNSFTMADGTVVTKQDDGAPSVPEEPPTTSTEARDTPDPPDEVPPKRDAEAVR